MSSVVCCWKEYQWFIDGQLATDNKQQTKDNAPPTTYNRQLNTDTKPVRMPPLKDKIESIMNSEGNPPALSLASLLYGVSIFYGAANRLRSSGYRYKLLPTRRLPCKVISVGNITVGGTGKTPMTIHVAGEIKRAGYQVAVISRGYKGGAEKHGGIVSDGRTLCMDAELAGDEPYLIAGRLKGVPVVVGKNRFAAGMLAVEKFRPDVIVLDDAFQHLKLKRDLDLVLLDNRHPFGNSQLLPRGILREPAASLARSTACILTRCKTGADEATMSSEKMVRVLAPDRPVFRSSHVPYCYAVNSGERKPFDAVADFFTAKDFEEIENRRAFCFSGIARNDDFRQTVGELGLNVSGFLEFPDHHPYTEDDMSGILRQAGISGADLLITTEKDHVRIAQKAPLPMALIVVGVRVAFEDDQQSFSTFIKDSLNL
jgi:tetraacyldisaccharide 4'-kinase